MWFETSLISSKFRNYCSYYLKKIWMAWSLHWREKICAKLIFIISRGNLKQATLRPLGRRRTKSIKSWVSIEWRKSTKTYSRLSCSSELTDSKFRNSPTKTTEVQFSPSTICRRLKICPKTVKWLKLRNNWMISSMSSTTLESFSDTIIPKSKGRKSY